MNHEPDNAPNFYRYIAESPLVAAMCFGAAAIAVGVGVAGFGSGSAASLLAAAVGVIAACAAAAVFIYDLPLIFFVEVIFAASFFFKADATLMKLDELEDPSGLNISLTLIAAVVLFASDLYNRRDGQSPRVFSPLFAVALGGLTVCAALSAFYGAGGRLGWFSFASFLSSCFICYVTAAHFGTRDKLPQFIALIAGGLLLTGVVAGSQFLLNFPKLPFLGTGTDEELLWTQAELFSRVSAFLRTPTEMGWVTATLLPLVVAPLLADARAFSRSERVVLILAALAGVAAIVLSLARGSWIALCAALLIIILCAWKNWEPDRRRHYFAAVGGLVLLGALALAPFGGKIYERLTTDDGESAAIRLPLMEVAINIIEENPLVGIGLSGYRTEMTRYDRTSVHVTQIFPGTVHNSFAHITAEIGVAGGLLFAALLLIAAFECWMTMKSGDKLLFALALGAFAALAAYTISALKEPGGLGSARPPVRTCFLLLGLIFAVSRCRRSTNAPRFL